MYIWGAVNFEVKHEIQQDNNFVINCVQFSPNDELILAGTSTGDLAIWSSLTFKL